MKPQLQFLHNPIFEDSWNLSPNLSIIAIGVPYWLCMCSSHISSVIQLVWLIDYACVALTFAVSSNLNEKVIKSKNILDPLVG